MLLKFREIGDYANADQAQWQHKGEGMTVCMIYTDESTVKIDAVVLPASQKY